MPRLKWDEVTKRLYETGVKQCVLYPMGSDGEYETGVAWSGITAITESPSGADETALWADDIKYISLRAREEFGGTIEAYMHPDAWAECDGSAEPATGMSIGQQTRKAFGLCYRTALGNDTQGDSYGYKLHIIYNATASPSERSYATMNDSPEAITFSWEFTTTPVSIEGYKDISIITIDSTKANADKLAALEAVLYGTDAGVGGTPAATDASLPSPDEVVDYLT